MIRFKIICLFVILNLLILNIYMLEQNIIDKTTYKKYDYDDKKKIVYKIQKIKNKKDYFKLYKLVNNNNIQFTKNNNGIFFNINKLSNQTLQEIEFFLDMINEKNKLIQDSELSNCESENILSTDEQINFSLNKNEINIKRKVLIE
jgi:hypothetical protein